jgi:hypothetical protein
MTEPMTDLADRLADALSARATAVLPDPRAYERVVARRRRRRVTRWAPVGAAALATAGVVALAMILPGGDHTPAPPAVGPSEPGGAPAQFIAVVDGKAAIYDSAKPDGQSSFTPTGYRTTAVAALGDDLHYWSASAAANGCRSLLQATDHSGVTFTAHDLKGGDGVAGEVDALAVTDDAARLAYTLRTGPQCDRYELHVRDLRTGADRAWKFPASTSSTSLRESLSWSPDGRHLAYLTGCCEPRELDTTAPGSDVLAPKWHEGQVRDPRRAGVECEVQAAAYRGTTGDLVAYVRCGGGEYTADYAFAGTYDPATGKIGTVLFDNAPFFVQRLAFDRSGEHALLGAGNGTSVEGEPDPLVLWRWDMGGDPRTVDAVEDPVFGVDW